MRELANGQLRRWQAGCIIGGMEKKLERVHYQAAGGVLIHDGQVLVLKRPGRNEVRLPKGHVEPGEDPRETALRETREESGYLALEIVADLGTHQLSFFNAYKPALVTRDSHYYLMRLNDMTQQPPEAQFIPTWVAAAEAEATLTFEEEREFARRALRALHDLAAA